jgi:predicted permease
MVMRSYRSQSRGEIEAGQTGRAWGAVRDHASFLEAAPFAQASGVNCVTQGHAQYVQQQRVGAGFFHVLGIAPLLGREFTSTEDRPGGPAAVVLSHALWQHAFEGNRSVLGRAVILRGEPYTVVGIMPPGFQSGAQADLWTPLRPTTTGEGEGENYGIAARLKPGVTWVQADAQVAALSSEALRKEHLPPGVLLRLSVVPLQRGLTEEVRSPVLLLWGAVGVVLLIACVNMASLLLARSASRQHEIATHLALGSGRLAVVRQLLAESLWLAVLGAVAGLALAYLGLESLRAIAKDTFEVSQPIALDARVLGFTAAISLLTSFIFGLAPALQSSRVDLRQALIESGGRAVAGHAHGWPRRVLVMGEVAMGVVLLIGAGLLIRSLANLSGLKPGFDPSHVIAADLSLQDARYATSQQVNELFDKTLARIEDLPGVESAAVVLRLPYQRLLNLGFRWLDGPNKDKPAAVTNLSYITPRYFETLRIPLLRGRAFAALDRANSQAVVIVNEAFVHRYLQGQAAIGSHIGVSNASREIVGVVGDTQQRSGWGNYGPIAPMPTAYIPATQTNAGFLAVVHTWFSPSWVVRTSGPVQGLLAGMQRAVESTLSYLSQASVLWTQSGPSLSPNSAFSPLCSPYWRALPCCSPQWGSMA